MLILYQFYYTWEFELLILRRFSLVYASKSIFSIYKFSVITKQNKNSFDHWISSLILVVFLISCAQKIRIDFILAGSWQSVTRTLLTLLPFALQANLDCLISLCLMVNLQVQIFQNFLLINIPLRTPPLRRDLVKILTRKLRHASSLSLECTDFKNIIFEKIPWAPSKVAEVAEVKQPRNTKRQKFSEPLLRLLRAPRSNDLKRGSGNFFKNYVFEISAFQGKRWGISQLSRQNFH